MTSKTSVYGVLDNVCFQIADFNAWISSQWCRSLLWKNWPVMR